MTFKIIVLMTIPAIALWAEAVPTISDVAVDYEAHRVTITGSNFSPHGVAPILAFADSRLSLVSFTDHSAVARLPAHVIAGSYLVSVTNGENRTGTFSVTVTNSFAPVVWNAKDKLRFHAKNAYGPLALVGSAAYAGLLQAVNAPREWGQGSSAYGQRFGSTLASSGIHGVLAFGLDTALHEDPRYYRSGSGGIWGRTAHALRGTLLTRTDSGYEMISVWRIGSAYGTAFISNQWYPDRLNTVRQGFLQGSGRLGFDFVSNLASEFWPDIKAKVLHRN